MKVLNYKQNKYLPQQLVYALKTLENLSNSLNLPIFDFFNIQDVRLISCIDSVYMKEQEVQSLLQKSNHICNILIQEVRNIQCEVMKYQHDEVKECLE